LIISNAFCVLKPSASSNNNSDKRISDENVEDVKQGEKNVLNMTKADIKLKESLFTVKTVQTVLNMTKADIN
jgi:hypothetical protein